MMAELASPADFGSSSDPAMVIFQAHVPHDSIQRSPIPADEPIGQRFQALRNPNEVNNVTLNNRQRIGSFQDPGLS